MSDESVFPVEPWVVREVWYMGGPNPDHVVDVTDRYPAKLTALRAHASQISHIDIDSIMRERMALVARAGGLAADRLAEAFTVIRTE